MDSFERGDARLRAALELRQSLIDEIEAYMSRSIAGALGGRGCLRQLDRFTRHLAFREGARLGDPLHDVAIAVARGEIHFAVGSAGILAEGLLDHAHGLDKLAPVHRAKKTQAADAVTDGNLIGGLLLNFGLHE